MELAESFEETARREVREETGLVVGALEVFCLNSGKGTLYQYPNGDIVYMACVIFRTQDFSGTLNAQKEETQALRWFLAHSLPERINLNDQGPLDKFVARL